MNVPWRLLHRALPILAACTLTGWVALHLGAQGVSSAWAALVAAVLIWPVTRRVKHGGEKQILAWDGQRWVWQEQTATVSVMLDLGNWLLLRVTQAQRQHWVPISLDRTRPAAAQFRAVLQAHGGKADRAHD